LTLFFAVLNGPNRFLRRGGSLLSKILRITRVTPPLNKAGKHGVIPHRAVRDQFVLEPFGLRRRESFREEAF